MKRSRIDLAVADFPGHRGDDDEAGMLEREAEHVDDVRRRVDDGDDLWRLGHLLRMCKDHASLIFFTAHLALDACRG